MPSWGFYRVQRTADDVVEESLKSAKPARDDTTPMRLVVVPGTAVIVVPGDHPVLLALVTGK